jgi:16S rRNA G527 N7-methylase RsmG
MVESRGRKAAFLREAVRELRLPNIDVESVRAEALPQIGAYEAITVRAVRLDREFVAAIHGLLSREGRVILFLPEPSGFQVEGFILKDHRKISTAGSGIGLFSREVLPD